MCFDYALKALHGGLKEVLQAKSHPGRMLLVSLRLVEVLRTVGTMHQLTDRMDDFDEHPK